MEQLVLRRGKFPIGKLEKFRKFSGKFPKRIFPFVKFSKWKYSRPEEPGSTL
jgi:hypothetical protein